MPASVGQCRLGGLTLLEPEVGSWPHPPEPECGELALTLQSRRWGAGLTPPEPRWELASPPLLL